ncbi:MAG: carboxylate-amine ligase [Holophagales bacterium]|nr:carboxylate-amine ligase [Holophagales bacterium]
MTEVADDVTITLGVEEELFLVDPDSRDLLNDPDPRIFEACGEASGGQKIVHEFLRSQIETNTAVHDSVAGVREGLKAARRLVVEAAQAHGAAVIGASTHPFAAWEAQLPTPKDRYRQFASTYQETVRRLVICGMHVHAGFGDFDTRVRVMTALRRYLPLFIGLSASSPFGEGRESGFKCNRLNLFEAMPRTSIPGPLASRAGYEALVGEYQRMTFITDGSEIWWDIRPSHKFPTVELRICDTCPAIEDAMCIVALYASLIRMLARRDREGALPPEPPTEIIVENKWLAQRYGMLAFLGDTRRGGRIDIADELQELADELAEDARALGCEQELRHCLKIVRDGSSADRQLDLYRLRLVEGASKDEALRDVVDLLVSETRADLATGGT